MKILVEHSIRDIPALEFYNPEAPEKLPAIIIMHGFSGRKEYCFTQGYQLAQQGYFAVSIDLHLHGENSDGDFISRYTRPERIMVVEYPGIGHETPPAMFERARQWFDEYLTM